ncbi:MAG: branched chain amino acid aminotransferase, partial [Planctomycetes bacterium RBG_16_59_8]
MVEKVKYIWMDGKLVDWEKATVHVLTHSLHYANAAFEGIRCYEGHDGKAAIFRLPEHIRRLYDSSKICLIDVPFTFDILLDACKETVRANGMKEAYIRPLVYIGEGAMGVHPRNNPIRVCIAVWKWGSYLGDDAVLKGARIKVSSYNRFAVNTAMTKGKLTGNYVTSVLAKREAVALGFDEALMLDPEGFVAEGSGENIFIVRDGKVKTTPLTSILPGITRDSVIRIARDLGYEVIEQRFSRDELYIADEVFFTGTAAEVTPIREIDWRVIGAGVPGPVTSKIRSLFNDIVRGRNEKYRSWLTP